MPPHHPRLSLNRALATALLVAIVAMVALAPARAAAARDEAAVAALQADGAFVSPRSLGEAAGGAAAQLATARAELLADRRDVAFAIVPGPVGAPTLTAYARRLHRAADLDGMLLVTAPGRAVAVGGAAVPAAAAAAIDRSGADHIANPVDRLITAAHAAVPQADEPDDGLRSIAILLVLAALGGAWAVAWGSHRTDRRGRAIVTEARSQLRVCVDALRSHAEALSAVHRAPAAMAAIDDVLELCTETVTAIHDARTFDDVWALVPRIRGGFESIAAIAAPGEDIPSAADPFAGLCTVDPVHGAATATGAVAGWDEPVPVCAACRAQLDRGQPLAPRLVPMERGAVAYTAVAPLLTHAPATSRPMPPNHPLNA